MKLHPALAASSLLAVALVVSTPLASADPVITDVNGVPRRPRRSSRRYRCTRPAAG